MEKITLNKYYQFILGEINSEKKDYLEGFVIERDLAALRFLFCATFGSWRSVLSYRDSDVIEYATPHHFLGRAFAKDINNYLNELWC
jgi:hypothetical protein